MQLPGQLPGRGCPGEAAYTNFAPMTSPRAGDKSRVRETLLPAALHPSGALWPSKGLGNCVAKATSRGYWRHLAWRTLIFYVFMCISPSLGRQQQGQLIPARCHLIPFPKYPFFGPSWWSPAWTLVLVQPCCSPALGITGRFPSPGFSSRFSFNLG